jgi:hypothetical protein
MPISFTIRVQQGSPLHLEAELTDTVLVLKQTLLTIVKERTWQPHTCRLLHLGKDLPIQQTLGECGMTEGASVTLHLLGPPPSANPPPVAPPKQQATSSSSSSSTLPGHGPTAPSPLASAPSTGGATPPTPALPVPTTNIHDIVALRHALGVALGERDAARGEVKSLQERLLNCEERLQRTSTTFEALAQQLTQLSTVATEAQINLFNN